MTTAHLNYVCIKQRLQPLFVWPFSDVQGGAWRSLPVRGTQRGSIWQQSKAIKSQNAQFWVYCSQNLGLCKLTAEVRWVSGRGPSHCHWPPWFCAAWAQMWTPLRGRGTQGLEVSFWPAASSAAQCPPFAGWCPPAAWADTTTQTQGHISTREAAQTLHLQSSLSNSV